MKDLMMVDVYQIRAGYPLDNLASKTMYQLYQPIISHQAVSLYFSLWAELDQLTLTKSPSLMSRLTKMTGLTLEALNENIKKLEAIGLLNTYVKKNQDAKYLFDLQLPLTPSAFFHHAILNAMLVQRLGQEDYQRTLICFQSYDVNKNDYVDTTASFDDVFDVYAICQDKQTFDKNYFDKKYNAIEKDYSLDLFYQGLENLQLSKKMLSQEDETLIKQLGILYKINALDMQDLVKESMNQQHLDKNALIKKCRHYFDLKMPEAFHEIYHKQSLAKMSQTGHTDFDKHIQYLESVTPYDLLKDKQGGKEPLKRDLQVVESILTTLQLEPGVMNALIELTLSQCHQTLSRNFMETQASRWKRKKIMTVKDAIEEGKAYIRYRHHYEDEQDIEEDVHDSYDEKQQLDDDTMKDILSNFG